jgi:hypothetical protein
VGGHAGLWVLDDVDGAEADGAGVSEVWGWAAELSVFLDGLGGDFCVYVSGYDLFSAYYWGDCSKVCCAFWVEFVLDADADIRSLGFYFGIGTFPSTVSDSDTIADMEDSYSVGSTSTSFLGSSPIGFPNRRSGSFSFPNHHQPTLNPSL